MTLEVVEEEEKEVGVAVSTHCLPSQHHVTLVQLNINVRLLVQQVVCPSRWGATDQLPVIYHQLMAIRCLQGEEEEEFVVVVMVKGELTFCPSGTVLMIP